jgi:RNase P subunit RPR2
MQYDELICKKCGIEIEPEYLRDYLFELFTMRYVEVKCHECGFENKITAIRDLEVEYYD